MDIDFNNSADRAKVLLQVCCYLRQIHEYKKCEWESPNIPVVLVLGSKINCMALHTKWLLPFAKDDIKGYKSASTAYNKSENMQLLYSIKDNDDIQTNSIVYDVNDKDCIKNICNSILKFGQDIDLLEDLSENNLSENNLSKAFDFFDMYVLDKKQANKLTSRQKVDLFIGTFYSDDFKEDKSSRWNDNIDTLVINGKKVKIDPIKYKNFKVMINIRQYSKIEQKEITAMTDRLIEDTDRRRKGDFYTPTIWVDEAHKVLSKHLGENWKDEYVVWDCAWGTGNLTRDYKFKHLYCSTLYEEDLKIGSRYNKNAVKFQYDFLNDDLGNLDENFKKLNKVAPELVEALITGDKILFLLNPPFGTSGEIKQDLGRSKAGIARTKIADMMKRDKMGQATTQLFCQFIYRICKIAEDYNNKQIELFIITSTNFYTSSNYIKMLDRLDINNLKFLDGFLIRSGAFSNVKDTWSITFALFNGKGVKEKFEVTIKDTNDKVYNICNKKLYHLNGNKASLWAKNLPTNTEVTKDTCYFKSALNVYHTVGCNRQVKDGFLGGWFNNANSIEKNNQFVAILSGMMGDTNCHNITMYNYDKVISVFTARRLISGNYINTLNCFDEYMIPNISHPSYSQWQSDCIVYSLFNSKSNQSSLRNIEYNGKTWNIQNEFFWMSVRDIENLAGCLYDKADINTKIEDDIEEFGNERFVYKKLQEVELSPDAQAVLDKATELVKLSFKYRKEFNEKHPEYHINTWDAGWYQIKGMLKEYMPNELKEFNSMYKALEDRMRPLVYELGFLYK